MAQISETNKNEHDKQQDHTRWGKLLNVNFPFEIDEVFVYPAKHSKQGKNQNCNKNGGDGANLDENSKKGVLGKVCPCMVSKKDRQEGPKESNKVQPKVPVKHRKNKKIKPAKSSSVFSFGKGSIQRRIKRLEHQLEYEEARVAKLPRRPCCKKRNKEIKEYCKSKPEEYGLCTNEGQTPDKTYKRPSSQKSGHQKDSVIVDGENKVAKEAKKDHSIKEKKKKSNVPALSTSQNDEKREKHTSKGQKSKETGIPTKEEKGKEKEIPKEKKDKEKELPKEKKDKEKELPKEKKDKENKSNGSISSTSKCSFCDNSLCKCIDKGNKEQKSREMKPKEKKIKIKDSSTSSSSSDSSVVYSNETDGKKIKKEKLKKQEDKKPKEKSEKLEKMNNKDQKSKDIKPKEKKSKSKESSTSSSSSDSSLVNLNEIDGKKKQKEKQVVKIQEDKKPKEKNKKLGSSKSSLKANASNSSCESYDDRGENKNKKQKSKEKKPKMKNEKGSNSRSSNKGTASNSSSEGNDDEGRNKDNKQKSKDKKPKMKKCKNKKSGSSSSSSISCNSHSSVGNNGKEKKKKKIKLRCKSQKEKKPKQEKENRGRSSSECSSCKSSCKEICKREKEKNKSKKIRCKLKKYVKRRSSDSLSKSECTNVVLNANTFDSGSVTEPFVKDKVESKCYENPNPPLLKLDSEDSDVGCVLDPIFNKFKRNKKNTGAPTTTYYSAAYSEYLPYDHPLEKLQSTNDEDSEWIDDNLRDNVCQTDLVLPVSLDFNDSLGIMKTRNIETCQRSDSKPDKNNHLRNGKSNETNQSMDSKFSASYNWMNGDSNKPYNQRSPTKYSLDSEESMYLIENSRAFKDLNDSEQSLVVYKNDKFKKVKDSSIGKKTSGSTLVGVRAKHRLRMQWLYSRYY